MKEKNSIDFLEELYSTIKIRAKSKKKILTPIYY